MCLYHQNGKEHIKTDLQSCTSSVELGLFASSLRHTKGIFYCCILETFLLEPIMLSCHHVCHPEDRESCLLISVSIKYETVSQNGQKVKRNQFLSQM